MNLDTIDVDLIGKSSAEILAMWQAALDERMELPPNERHFELSQIIDRLAAALQPVIVKEHAEALVAAEAARVAAEAAAALKTAASGPDVPQLVYGMKLSVWAVTRAIGPEQCRLKVERQIAECLADDSVQ
jgi:hypothetical protein